MVVESLIWNAMLNTNDFNSGLQKMVTELKGAAGAGDGLLAKMTSLSTIQMAALAAGVLAVAAALTKSVQAAAQWQSQMVEVEKVTNFEGAKNDIAGLSKELLNLRAKTGASFESISGAAAGAGRMGIGGDEIAGYTEKILQMSSAWGVSADFASDAMGKIGTAVKPADMAWEEFAGRIGSTINDLADSMATSENAITQGMMKLTGTMNTLKVEPDQLGGWASLVGYLQAMGDTEVGAGEHIKDMFREMTKSTHGEDIAAILGLDFATFQEKIREDAIGTVQELGVAISQMDLTEQGDAFALFGDSGAEAMKKVAGGVDQTTGKIPKLQTAIDTANAAWIAGGDEATSSMTAAYEKSMQTLESQTSQFMGKLSVIGVQIGTALLPGLTAIVSGANTVVDAFMRMGTAIASAVKGSSLFASFQNLFSSIQSSMSGVVSTIVDPIREAFSSLNGLAGGDVLGAAFDAMTKPAAIVVDLLSDVVSIAGKIASAVLKITFVPVVKSITELIQGLTKAKELVTEFINAFKETDTFNSLSTTFNNVVDTIKTTWDGLKTALPTAIEGATTAIQTLFDKFFTWLEDKFGWILEAVEKITGFSTEDIIPDVSVPEGGVLGDVLSAGKTAWAKVFGEDIGEEVAAGVAETTEDEIPKNLEETLEDVDAEGAGEDAGKSFGDEFLKGFKDAKISEELAGFISAGFSDAAAVAAYNAQHTSKFARSGAVDLGDLGEGEFVKKSTGKLNWQFLVNGHVLKSGATPSDVLELLTAEYPAIAALIDPREMEAAIAGAQGDFGQEMEIRARIIADLELQDVLNAQEAEWLAAEEAFQEMMDGLSQAYHEAFDDAMGEGVIIDWAIAWEDAGEMAADAFSDNLISGVEARDVAGALQDLKILDPAAFEEMGGEAALAAWGGLVEVLEARADYLASLPIGVEADPDKLRQFQDDIVAAKEAIEPLGIEVQLIDNISPESAALREALWWKDYGGSQTKRGLGEMADDMYVLGEAAEMMGGDFADAYEIITNPWDYASDEIYVAQNYLKSMVAGLGIDPAVVDDLAEWWVKHGKAGMEKGTQALATQKPDWMSSFGWWQENTEGLFAGESGYIGQGGTGAYAEFDTLRDMSLQAQKIEFAITAQGLDPESPEAAALLADYNEIRTLAVALDIQIPSDQAWVEKLFGSENVIGKAELGGTGTENYLSYDVTADTSRADAAIAAMEAEAESTRITPIDADISLALAQNAILEAELSAPVTKTVYIKTVGDTNASSSLWGNADWHGAFGVAPGNYSNRVLSFANEGVVSTPTRAIIGDAPVPEAVMRVDTLYNFVQQAVASAGGGGGSNITVNAPITVYGSGDTREIAEEVAAELEIRISKAYSGRSRGGL